MDLNFPMLTWTGFKCFMNKLSSPHVKSCCLRNLSVLLETILAGWEDETDYLIEFFQLSLFFFFFYPVGTMLWTGQLQKFNGISPIYIKAISSSATRKQFVVHEQYLLPLRLSQDVFQTRLREAMEGIWKNWNKWKNTNVPKLEPKDIFF